MPQHASAERRVRLSETRRLRNISDRSRMKTAIKKVKTAEDKETASKELISTISLLDKLAAKGLIHKNKAANLKSKLSRKVNSTN